MSNDKNSWRSALTVAGMAAAGTLAAKLVQVGFDTLFSRKSSVDMKRNTEWLNSARLIATVTRIRVDSLQLAYTGNLGLKDSIADAFDALRQKAASIEHSLGSLQAMSEGEFLSFKFQADSLRCDIHDLEKVLRDRGLVEPAPPRGKEVVEAVVLPEERKDESHDKAAEQPAFEPESDAGSLARTDDDPA